MDFSEQDNQSAKKLVGISIVVLIHVLLIYALIHGLGQQIISVIKEIPMKTVFVETIKPLAPPAPPAPPVPPVAPPSLPKKIVASKPVIPLPEVQTPQAPAQNAIQDVSLAPQETSTQRVPNAASVVAQPLAVTQAVVDFATCKKPDYPRNALRNEEQGTVRLQFLIGLDGHVADSKIEKSSGFRALDTAAKKALSLCKFKPGTVDGKPQQSWTKVDYVWKLPD